MVIVHTFQSIQDTFEARASEWMLTFATISLAVVFFFNEPMFYREAFDGLRQINSNHVVWAAVLGTIGVTGLVVLLINGSYWRTPHFRAIMAFLRAGVWFFLALGFVRNGSVMIALVPWIFFLDAYNAKRAAREAGQSEFVGRHMRKRNARIAQVTHT